MTTSEHYSDDCNILILIIINSLFVLVISLQFPIRSLFPQSKKKRMFYGLVVPGIVITICVIKDVACGFLGEFLYDMDLFSIIFSSCLTTALSFTPLLIYTIYDRLFWLYPFLSLGISSLFAYLYVEFMDDRSLYTNSDYFIIAIQISAGLLVYSITQWLTSTLGKSFLKMENWKKNKCCFGLFINTKLYIKV